MSDYKDDGWEEVASVKTSCREADKSSEADLREAILSAAAAREAKDTAEPATPEGDKEKVHPEDPVDLKEALRKSGEAAGPKRRLVNRLLLILVVVLGIAMIAAAVIFVRVLVSSR